MIENIRQETLRPTNPGAEAWLGKVTPVLDHGFIKLLDYMGGDQDIENAARISYGEGTRKASETRGLLRYLLRNEHTSPFEMVEFKFHQKMPIFVARQWVRHRTASLNEYSARYSVVKNEFYIPNPEVISVQSTDNKQGRGRAINENLAKEVQQRLKDSFRDANDLYQWLLDPEDGAGIAREIARLPMPVAAYTEWYWKCDLHNILHLLKLRMDPHAQYEIREHANAMAKIIKDSVPITWEAFEDYKVNSLSLTRPEKSTLVNLFHKHSVIFEANEVSEALRDSGLINKREASEFNEKLKKLGLLDQST